MAGLAEDFAPNPGAIGYTYPMAIGRTSANSSRRKTQTRRPQKAKTFWDDLAAIGRKIPKAEIASLPRDAARRFDEYFDDVKP